MVRLFIIIITTIIILGRRKAIVRSGPGAANIICTINPIVMTASLEPRDNNNTNNKHLHRGLTFIRNNNNHITTITTSIINIQWNHRSVVTVKV